MKHKMRIARKMADLYGVSYKDSTTYREIKEKVNVIAKDEYATLATAALETIVSRHGGQIKCMDLPEDEWQLVMHLVQSGARIPDYKGAA